MPLHKFLKLRMMLLYVHWHASLAEVGASMHWPLLHGGRPVEISGAHAKSL